MSIAHYQRWQLERTRDSARWNYVHALKCMGKGWDNFWMWANQAQDWRELWISALRELRSRGIA